jgi:prophage antirepressor-like protein
LIKTHTNNNDVPWFSGMEVATLLQYVNTQHAISNNVSHNVDPEDKIFYKKLWQFLEDIPKNAQPLAIYINEFGLFSLMISSGKKFPWNLKGGLLPKVFHPLEEQDYTK